MKVIKECTENIDIDDVIYGSTFIDEPEEGTIHFSSKSNKMFVYSGKEWLEVGSHDTDKFNKCVEENTKRCDGCGARIKKNQTECEYCRNEL